MPGVDTQSQVRTNAPSGRLDEGPQERVMPKGFPATGYAAQQASVAPAAAAGVETEKLDDGAAELKAPDAAAPTGPTFKSDRFQRDPVLQKVLEGKQYLRQGSGGLAVRKLQQALLDLGYTLPKFGVDGSFGGETDKAVRAFQAAEGAKEDGVVGPETLGKLDARYATFQPYVALAQGAGKTEAEQLAKTRTLKPSEAEAATNALAQNKPGATGPFKETLPDGRKYEPELEKALIAATDEALARLVTGKADKRKDAANLYDWKEIEDVATIGKRETDAVFGSYASKPALKSGINLKDQWEVEEKKQGKMTADQLLDVARELTDYFLQTRPQVLAVKKEHSAGSGAKETAIALAVRERVAKARTADLCAIQKAWPGEATPSTGEVRIQRFKGDDAAKTRQQMWRYLRTFIHEYLHTATHPKYFEYAGTLSGDRENALSEGMTDVLTKTVWSKVAFADPKLQKDVEGPYFVPGSPVTVPDMPQYRSTPRAEEMMGIVGAHNVYAAYFLGHTKLIGDKRKAP